MLKSVSCSGQDINIDKKVEILKKYYIDFFGEKYASQIEERLNKIVYIVYKPFQFGKKFKEEMVEFIDACADDGTVANEVLNELLGSDDDKIPKENDVAEAVIKKCMAEDFSVVTRIPIKPLIDYVTLPGVPGDAKHVMQAQKLHSVLNDFVSYRLRRTQFYEKLNATIPEVKNAIASLKALQTYIGHKHFIDDCGPAINALRAPFCAEGKKIGEKVMEDHYMGRYTGISASILQIKEGKYVVPFLLIKEGFPNNILVHELLHGITTIKEGDSYKVGVAPGFGESKYVAFNEVLTDYFSTKIHNKMRENGELVGDPKIPLSFYALAFGYLGKIIDNNVELFKDEMMSNDPFYLEKKIGKANCEKLLAIANCILGKNQYFKPYNPNDIDKNKSGNSVDTKNLRGEAERLYQDMLQIQDASEKN